MTTAEQMPELPKPFMELNKEISPHVYAAWADQMHAYARAYAAQEVAREREACAKVCESIAMAKHAAWRGNGAQYDCGASDGADQCADAIRARNNQS